MLLAVPAATRCSQSSTSAMLDGTWRRPATLPEIGAGPHRRSPRRVLGPRKALLQEAPCTGRSSGSARVAAASGVPRYRCSASLRHWSGRTSSGGSGGLSVAGDTEYSFQHVLLRDVAYGQIPRRERAEKHRRAAEWIEGARLPGRPCRAARLPLHAGARARSRGSPRIAGARAPRGACAPRRGCARRRVERVHSRRPIRRSGVELFADHDPARPHALAVRAKALYFVGAENAIELLEDVLSGARRCARDRGRGGGRSAACRGVLVPRPCVFDHLERAQALVADAPVSAAKAARGDARCMGLGGDWGARWKLPRRRSSWRYRSVMRISRRTH